jgi:putative transposase
MGSIGECFDNSSADGFCGTLQLELFDEHQWESRRKLVLAIFERIEVWYNPHRRHHEAAHGA